MMSLRRRLAAAALRGLALSALALASPAPASASCAAPANAVEAENCRPGNPQSQWDISPASGNPTIQGFSTEFSHNAGETISFKINAAANYRVDIYRLGYYGGLGGRLVASVNPTGPLSQPACQTDSATGLIDCGNWSVSATWSIPASAVSGVYVAKLVRLDTGGASHIPFVVRNDAGTEKILFMTADTTWQAYNHWGGNSLYIGAPTGTGAYKVSYNRPFINRINYPTSLFHQEYPMLRWLEANGYDVAYFSNVDNLRRGALIGNHDIFMPVGHQEYWSAAERANVEAARAAGVHLAFFSSVTSLWKTRWEPALNGVAERTLVCYKESGRGFIDPTATWTGLWRDKRGSPPADGGVPESLLTAQSFSADALRNDTMLVPALFAPLRFWRNSGVASLTAGQAASFAQTLGMEWDVDWDNGARPAGVVRLSSTTVTVPKALISHLYAVNYPITHRLLFYKHASGALVFSAGTMQWGWALEPVHSGGQAAPVHQALRQATVNILGDMGAQPASLQSGLVPASPSTDAQAPVAFVTPPSGVDVGQVQTISGTATDSGDGVVGAVEVSTDNATWHPAEGRSPWTYAWTMTGPASVRARAVDDSGNIGAPTAPLTVAPGSEPEPEPNAGPYSLFATTAPGSNQSVGDTNSVELGMRFRPSRDGQITGIRFYKFPANTGPHSGRLWTNNGTLLGAVNFTGETASGWQTAMFPTPIAITSGTTYVASYHSNTGYAATRFYFATPRDVPPLHAPASATGSLNGVYLYGTTPGFPTQSTRQSNYWVDVLFTTSEPVASTSCVTSSAGTWQNLSFATQAGQFDATFEATPGQNGMDGQVGLSNGAADDLTELASIVRFNSSGFIDARNGANYAASLAVPYTAATTYRFRVRVDVQSHQYTVFVSTPGGSEQLLASQFDFRTEQAAVTQLNNLALRAGPGSETVCHLAITPVVPASTISALSPSSAAAGGPDFTLSVLGSGFTSTSLVRWNTSPRPTTFISSSELHAEISSADIASPGTASITVADGSPGGGVSNAMAFSVYGGSAAFIDDFSQPDGLITNENPSSPRSAKWLVNEGSLFVSTGQGWTGVPDNVAPNATSSNGTGSALFRALTVPSNLGSDVSLRFTVQNFVSVLPAQTWDGAHLFLRYLDASNYYQISLRRRDGRAGIKKRRNGTISTFTTPLYGAPALGTPQTARAVATTNPNGSVTIQMFVNGTLVASAVDTANPIIGLGKVVVAAENTNFRFDDFTAAPTSSTGGTSVAALSSEGEMRFAPASMLVSNEYGGRVERIDATGVHVPENALGRALEITVDRADESKDAETKRARRRALAIAAATDEIEFRPTTLSFAQPVTVVLGYDPKRLEKAGLKEDELKVYSWNPTLADWQALPSAVDREARTVSAQTDHFSTYQAMAPGDGIGVAAADPSFGWKAVYAFPNPARDTNRVGVIVQPGIADSVEIAVYDLSGRKIHSSTDFRFGGALDDGNGLGAQYTYAHVWDVSGVASGVYTYVITARKAGEGEIRKSGKLAVIK